MNLRRHILVAIAILSTLTVARAAEAEKAPARLVVQTLRSDDALKPLAQDLTEELVVYAARLGRSDGLVVLSESEVELMLEHLKDRADLDPADCKKVEECLARIFATEAELVLRGRVDRLGDSLVVVLSLIDVAKGEVARSRSCAAEDRAELVEALKVAAAEILGYGTAEPAEAEPAIPADGRKVGVVPLSGLAEKPDIAMTLTDVLGISIRELGFSALTRDEILSMLHYAIDRHGLANDGSPLTDALLEVAGAMGVDLLATGSVGRVEETYVIVLKLIDIERGAVIRRVLEPYRGPAAYLPHAMRFATGNLFGREPSGEAGAVSILTEVEGEYRIDRAGASPLPPAAPIAGLPAGKHQINISAEGYYPYFADLYAEAEPLRFRPELEALPPEWYETWWFWSIAGAVAAGTTAAILIATVPPKGALVDGGL